MAAQEKPVPALTVLGSVLNTDQVVCVSNASGNAVTGLVSVEGLFSSTANLTIILPALGTPANSTSMTVAPGTVWYDASFLYVAVANNNTKRVSLSSF